MVIVLPAKCQTFAFASKYFEMNHRRTRVPFAHLCLSLSLCLWLIFSSHSPSIPIAFQSVQIWITIEHCLCAASGSFGIFFTFVQLFLSEIFLFFGSTTTTKMVRTTPMPFVRIKSTFIHYSYYLQIFLDHKMNFFIRRSTHVRPVTHNLWDLFLYSTENFSKCERKKPTKKKCRKTRGPHPCSQTELMSPLFVGHYLHINCN